MPSHARAKRRKKDRFRDPASQPYAPPRDCDAKAVRPAPGLSRNSPRARGALKRGVNEIVTPRRLDSACHAEVYGEGGSGRFGNTPTERRGYRRGDELLRFVPKDLVEIIIRGIVTKARADV
jgi:hypothetical protein